jgi:hypothetical protein
VKRGGCSNPNRRRPPSPADPAAQTSKKRLGVPPDCANMPG